MTGTVWESVSPEQSFFDGDAVMVGLSEFTVLDYNSIETVAGADRFHQHAIVDMLEAAMGDRYLFTVSPDPDTCRIEMLLESELS